MTATRELLSVGIDVGTTTTQIVLSQLVVRDVARLGAVPRLAIDTRSVRHASEVLSTPLTAPDEVDVDALVAIIRAEYAAAGVTPADVDTGAIIITGETARARNAEAILAAAAGLAGDFVVTVAGPSLEAQIAGRGSGAAAWSAQQFTQVTNVDIGGGSSNAAIFKIGEHACSAAIEVGGRQLQLDRDGTVRHLAPPGQALVDALGLDLVVGRPARMADLRRFCDQMADMIVDLTLGKVTDLHASAALTPPLVDAEASTAVFLSGGVGRCVHDELPAATLDDVAVFGDVGPLLARALRENPRFAALPLRRPVEDLRATVLGAASQTVTLSGTTIWAEERLLPLRNLPVVRPELDLDGPSPDLAEAINLAIQRWDLDGAAAAIAIEPNRRIGFEELQAIADAVIDVTSERLADDAPVVLVTEHDVAKALGQAITSRRPGLPVVAIDQIGLREGDYIDIGTPMMDGRVVPVSVKTLVFTT